MTPFRSFVLTALLVLRFGMAVALYLVINHASQSREPASSDLPGSQIPSNAPAGNQQGDHASNAAKGLVDPGWDDEAARAVVALNVEETARRCYVDLGKLMENLGSIWSDSSCDSSGSRAQRFMGQ